MKRWLIIVEIILGVVLLTAIAYTFIRQDRILDKYRGMPSFDAVETTLKDQLELIRNNPNNDGSYYSLGQGFYGLQGYDDAIWALSEAVKLAPNKHYYWSFLGKAYQARGKYDVDKQDTVKAKQDYENARDAYVKALELEPNKVNNYTTLAWLYYFRLPDEISKAYDVLKKGLEKFPTDKDILFDITRYYMYDKNEAEFLKYAPMYLKIAPDDTAIKDAYKKMLNK